MDDEYKELMKELIKELKEHTKCLDNINYNLYLLSGKSPTYSQSDFDNCKVVDNKIFMKQF
jgi:hypothetical protein